MPGRIHAGIATVRPSTVTSTICASGYLGLVYMPDGFDFEYPSGVTPRASAVAGLISTGLSHTVRVATSGSSCSHAMLPNRPSCTCPSTNETSSASSVGIGDAAIADTARATPAQSTFTASGWRAVPATRPSCSERRHTAPKSPGSFAAFQFARTIS